jgi:synaptobrevin family protein YKT6
MNFFSRTVAERTPPGQRQSIQENSYTAHVYSRQSDNLAGVIVTDQEYPVRVAFSLLNKILDEFTTKVQKSDWENKAAQGRQSGKQVLVEYPQLAEYLAKYQDPRQADAIMKVQQELDETKIVLVRFLSLSFTSFPFPAHTFLAPPAAQDHRVGS